MSNHIVVIAEARNGALKKVSLEAVSAGVELAGKTGGEVIALLIGANLDDDNGADSGSAYLFDASTGTQIAKLLSNDGAARDQFGWSIKIILGDFTSKNSQVNRSVIKKDLEGKY